MKQFIVDAFTSEVFSGNPAAICVMDRWPDESIMMKMAMENNLSETAFLVKEKDGLRLRWFTPGGEIDLCGHATLATAFVYMNFYEKDLDSVKFNTMSGPVYITRRGDLYDLNLPSFTLHEVPVTDEMSEALGTRPEEAYMGRDLLLVYKDEEIVRNMNPDQKKVQDLDGLLCHVTAPGKDYDCVSRSFAPKLSVAEDPVCGSGHCHIIPYWSRVLGKKEIFARQASKRGGTLHCLDLGDRIRLSGNAVLYSEAEVHVDL